MPVGYSTRCRACNSAHRAEIDELLLGGKTPREVSAWLEQTHSESLSHKAINQHRANHLNVLKEAKARMQDVQPEFDEAVNKVVAELEVLDELAGIGLGVARALQHRIMDSVFPAQVTLFGIALRETREAVKAKYEILEGKKVNLDGFGGLAELLTLGFSEESSSEMDK